MNAPCIRLKCFVFLQVQCVKLQGFLITTVSLSQLIPNICYKITVKFHCLMHFIDCFYENQAQMEAGVNN